jgi:hypothetical protein
MMGEKGIKLTTSLPYQQWGNYTENNNRKIRLKTGTLMSHARTIWPIPEHLRVFAIMHATLLINTKKDHPNTTRKGADIPLGKSPYELLKGREFNENLLHTFGAKAWYSDEHRKSKGDDRRKMGYHMGISADEKGWNIYCPETKRVVESRNVCFDDLNETATKDANAQDYEADTYAEEEETETFAEEERNPNFMTLTDDVCPEYARKNMPVVLRSDPNRDTETDILATTVHHIALETETRENEATSEEQEECKECKCRQRQIVIRRVEVQREGDNVRWSEVSDYLKERTPAELDERLIVMVDDEGEELTLITNETFQEIQDQAMHDPEEENMQWEGKYADLEQQLLEMTNDMDEEGETEEWTTDDENQDTKTVKNIHSVERQAQEDNDESIRITDTKYRPPKHRHLMRDDPYRDHYRIAEANELRKLNDKGFIEYWNKERYEEHLKKGGNKAIPFRWAYNVKMSKDELGKVNVFKARLALRGDLQKEHFEPHQTYAPTASQGVIRTVMVVGLMNNMEYYQYDAPAAFLNAKPDRA